MFSLHLTQSFLSVAFALYANVTAPQDFKKKGLLYQDNFDTALVQWVIEQVPGGTTGLKNSWLEIDDDKGCTVWFKEKLEGNISIEYDAVIIDKGGPNDRGSDLNCFWMAVDPENEDDIFAKGKDRTGKFANYHCMQLYYVGYGANNNTTTRFRRYPGDCTRPMLPNHDLVAAEYMNEANEVRHIQIISFNGTQIFKVDGQVVFNFKDNDPYLNGWFGFRTVNNHMKIDNFSVFRIE